jgi:2-dehydro-3-deoxyphosphooctonate aldolase (KDO 8-P synthase)
VNATIPCRIGDVKFGEGKLAIIAGPCMAESLELCLTVAAHLKELCGRLGIGYVFKASYDKANRTSGSSYRGPGLEQGLAWLERVASELELPVLTDVHEPSHCAVAAEVVDALQIPAFLCRQTDLILAAAATGKCVNIKKGQFMAPWDMAQAVAKVRETGNDQVLLTERGTSFGYNRLVTDFRGLPVMQQHAPVVFDATHSVQEPGGLGASSGGQRQFAPLLAGAAMACGADGLFIETHPQPDAAKSDAASQIRMEDMAAVLVRCLGIYEAAR